MVKLGRWLVTSAWPYINYMPHLGTIIGSVLSADVAARYLRLRGDEVLFVSGSDEHGTPIELEAIKKNVRPEELTEKNHATITELFKEWQISFDNYTRTESPTHKKLVQEILLKIYQNGYVFAEEIVFPYCPNCNRFLPDRFIQGECPRCGFTLARGDQCDSCGWPLEPSKLIKPACAICGGTPEFRKTKHWYLDLPKFADEIRRFIEENPRLPDNARNFSLNLIREGLKPRSITRDNEWGIAAPFPEAEGKTIYVWMEAVLGYISATVEYFERSGVCGRWRDYWFNPSTRTVYFIGKDNIPFHTIMLPALLRASGESYNLPWTVSSTEFLMFDGQKFSKSRRVGVWIDEALELYPVDYWRYTLLAIRPETKDTNFTWETFVEKVNSDLNDTLGNFIHRTLTFLDRYFGGRVPKPAKMDEYDRKMLESIRKCQAEVDRNMEQFRLQAVTSSVMGLAHAANKYLNDREPWKTIKSDPAKAATTLYVATQIVKSLAMLLEPIIPSTAEGVWRMLSLPGDVHSQHWDEVTKEVPPGQQIRKPKMLFRKTSLSEVGDKLKQKELKEKSGMVITAEEFSRVDLRVGKIVDAQLVPNSAKLVKLRIDLGEGEPKTAVAGIREHYRPKDLKDKLVAVLTNIEPSNIFGITSEVMILAASDNEKVVLLKPDKPLKVGSKIW